MDKVNKFSGTVSQYHFYYLKHLLRSRNIRYRKDNPQDTAEPYYLQALQRRILQTPTHLRSLQNFLNLCDTIHNQSNPPPL